ncbi:CBS domain-containing protein [Haloplanus halophilus]|uniref:CBS domain-containing protein n=1 Tax=Haloplanus halophilus TaxID=2949993 RepID=UPI00203FCF05|nr:CBS domain-containing protein [Haloplanus sp. GDY1]
MIRTTVDAVGLREPPTISPGTSASAAAAYLRRATVSALPVLADGDVVGVVTDSDLVAMVAETADRPAVRAIMSAPVTTISPDSTVCEAAERMRTAGVKHLPVVTDEGYRGVVSAADLAPYLPRYSLDIEWQDDPLSVGTDGGRKFPAGD